MTITRDQALAELQKRGVQMPQQPEPVVFTREQALEELQRRGAQSLQQPKNGIKPSSIIEPAATLVSGAIAEPIAGLAGLASATFAPSPEEAVQRGAEAVGATREALTYQPRTEAGQQALQAVGGVLAPVGQALQAAETFLGDETFEATGSPALAAAATTLPTAIIEALGIAGSKGIIKGAARTRKLARNREIKQALVAAAPEIDQIKQASRAVYMELDDAGLKLKPKTFKDLNAAIKKDLKSKGFRERLAPQTANVLKEFDVDLGKSLSLSDLDELRTVAQGAARTLDPNDARLGSLIIENIDNFLDTTSPDSFVKGTLKTSEISPKYKVARDLWGRARRSELINEAFEKAKNQASGFENGVVTQMRSILNNKKKVRFFKPEEIKAMQEVVRGKTSTNIAKLIGRLGFSEGHATNILGGALGVGAGAAAFGAPGAIAVPVIGQVSRKLAQRLTRKGAKFADAVVRAGDNADNIVKAYIANTPKSIRNPAELSELFLKPNINVDTLLAPSNKMVKEAAEIAKGRKALMAAGSAAGLGSIKEQSNKKNKKINGAQFGGKR